MLVIYGYISRNYWQKG